MGSTPGCRPIRASFASITPADIPGARTFGIYETGKDQPVLADGVVRHIGEPVLALVGDADAVASVRDEELPIAWAPLPPLDVGRHWRPVRSRLHADFPGNVLVQGRVAHGDVDEALASAAVVVVG